MSTPKPTRAMVLLNVLALQAYSVIASLYFATGRPIFGAIWGTCAVVWVWTVMTSVRTYGSQCSTAAYREMRWSRT